MPCYYCCHFDETKTPRNNSLGAVEHVKQVEGRCTLSPKWETVTGLHYCSQLSMKEPHLVGQWWVYMHESRRAFDEERRLRKDAEKKLKELKTRKSSKP